MSAGKLNPYIRIMLAAANGRGVTLTPDEAFDMSLDTAIATTAILDLDDLCLELRDGKLEKTGKPPIDRNFRDVPRHLR